MSNKIVPVGVSLGRRQDGYANVVIAARGGSSLFPRETRVTVAISADSVELYDAQFAGQDYRLIGPLHLCECEEIVSHDGDKRTLYITTINQKSAKYAWSISLSIYTAQQVPEWYSRIVGYDDKAVQFVFSSEANRLPVDRLNAYFEREIPEGMSLRDADVIVDAAYENLMRWIAVAEAHNKNLDRSANRRIRATFADQAVLDRVAERLWPDRERYRHILTLCLRKDKAAEYADEMDQP